MDDEKQYQDNYGSVVKEIISLEIMKHIIGNNTSCSSGAPANVSHTHQKTRHNRRLELFLQLADLRKHDWQQH